MLELGNRACFFFQRIGLSRVVESAAFRRKETLDSNITLKTLIEGLVNRTNASTTNTAFDVITFFRY